MGHLVHSVHIAASDPGHHCTHGIIFICISRKLLVVCMYIFEFPFYYVIHVLYFLGWGSIRLNGPIITSKISNSQWNSFIASFLSYKPANISCFIGIIQIYNIEPLFAHFIIFSIFSQFCFLLPSRRLLAPAKLISAEYCIHFAKLSVLLQYIVTSIVVYISQYKVYCSLFLLSITDGILCTIFNNNINFEEAIDLDAYFEIFLKKFIYLIFNKYLIRTKNVNVVSNQAQSYCVLSTATLFSR
uniref:7TM_GPCR_Srx domain-containing protein n=1 Tax=Heterorhabditis bacteriophora TaxID=37862 RepID=A0A1I7W661_HETBA